MSIKRMKKTAASALVLCLAGLLQACGGGGSSPLPPPQLWSQQAYLKAPNAGANDHFGGSVEASGGTVAVSGDTVVVGAYVESSNQTTITNGPTANADNSASMSGAAYVFTRSGSTWSQQAYLKAHNAGKDDGFGSSVAVSGDTVVVGAYGEASKQTTITNGTPVTEDNSADNSANSAGAAYVFTRSGNNWSQQAYLKAPNAEGIDRFGSSVAVSGDTVVVGAPTEASTQTTITNGASASADNSATAVGAAYVFTRSGNNWSQQAYLKASNAGACDVFGRSVAVSGDTVVVSAPAEDSTHYCGPASADNSTPNSGAAYVFVRSGSDWSQQAYLKAPNAGAYDFFGSSVAVSGDTVVVGAYGESSNQTTITNGASASTDNTVFNSGAAYVFTRSGNNWSQQAYLKAPNAGAYDYFGSSVAVSGDTVVVGAHGEDSDQTTITNGTAVTDSGAAYVFTRSGGNWSQQTYLKAPNAGADDYFGRSVAVSGNTVVVGADGEDSNQTAIINGSTASADDSTLNAGAAYVFQLN